MWTQSLQIAEVNRYYWRIITKCESTLKLLSRLDFSGEINLRVSSYVIFLKQY